MGIFKKNNNKKDTPERKLPLHIGIIMDGNGRWAKKRGLPRSAGHKVGASNFRTITKYCSNIGIKYLTVYAFSTENWKRSTEEVNFLMNLFEEYLKEALEDFQDENIKINFLGDTSSFSAKIQELIKEVKDASAKNDGMVLNIAMNYGSRDEITYAAKQIASDVKNGIIEISDINEDLFASKLYTANQPDPDLIIRPSGEYRLSNFLLWQSAYAELVVMDVLWPDFKEKDLERALDEYSSRNRRFGGV